MDKEFKNTASPSERARQFIEDQRRLRQPPQGTTYHQLQHVDIELEAQGRFAGTKPEMGPEYPRQPDTSPWSMQNLPEPTINAAEMFAVEACCEPHEVALAAEIEQARMVEAGGSVEAPLPTQLLMQLSPPVALIIPLLLIEVVGPFRPTSRTCLGAQYGGSTNEKWSLDIIGATPVTQPRSCPRTS
jgi:hypothetical protein